MSGCSAVSMRSFWSWKPPQCSPIPVLAPASKERIRAAPEVGHNPGSSWAIYAMLLFTLGLGLTGLPTGVEAFEVLHGPLAFLLLLVVVAHLIGIVWHTIRHRENIALSMVHGKKQGEAEQGLRSAHAAAGLVMLALTVGSAALLFAGYDPTGSRVVLPLVGTTITLGDGEEEGHGRDGERKHGQGRVPEE
jgi:hypothetical protein